MTAAHRLPARHGRRRASFVELPIEHRVVARERLRDLADGARADVEVPRWLVAVLPAVGLLGTVSGWATYLLHR